MALISVVKATLLVSWLPASIKEIFGAWDGYLMTQPQIIIES